MFPSLNRDDELNLAFAVIHSPSCQVGKHDEAWMILKQIHDTNMRARGQPEKVFTVSVCVCVCVSFQKLWMLKTAKRFKCCHHRNRLEHFNHAGSQTNPKHSNSFCVI